MLNPTVKYKCMLDIGLSDYSLLIAYMCIYMHVNEFSLTVHI